MIADAIQKIIDISRPHYLESNSGTYADKRMERIPADIRANPIKVKSLSGFADYIKKIYADDTPLDQKYFVLIESETKVSLVSYLDKDKKREYIITAEPEIPNFGFDRFVRTDSLIIQLQSMFVNDAETDLSLIQKFAGTTTAGTIKEYSDDGITQQATVKQGARGKVDDIVPNPCKLRPIRTFTEVEQPASLFVFRLEQGSNETVTGALFEADGGAWKLEAMSNIKRYLDEELKETGVKVIG